MFSAQRFIRNRKFQEKFALKEISGDDLNKFHGILLEMYQDILMVCKQNGIKILLGGGSALGAVRHSGFIPWDEDIDLMIDVSDFEKFLQEFSKQFSYKYYIISPSLFSDYPYMLMQIVKKDTYIEPLLDSSNIRPSGVTIDINVVINVPDNTCFRLIHGLISNILYFVINSKEYCLSISKRSLSFFSMNISSFLFYIFRLFVGLSVFFVPYRILCYLFYRWSKICNSVTSKITIATGRKHYFGECLNRNIFYPHRLTTFEGLEAYIPNFYECYLENLFGSNFMEIPPEDKREPHAYVSWKLGAK